MLPVDHHVHLERGPYTFEWLDAFLNRAAERGIARVAMVEHSTQFRSLDWHMQHEIQPDTDTNGSRSGSGSNAIAAESPWSATLNSSRKRGVVVWEPAESAGNGPAQELLIGEVQQRIPIVCGECVAMTRVAYAEPA